jgi:hypothetical protein
VSVISAMIRAICAASTFSARSLTSCKRQASGSNPLTGSQVSKVRFIVVSKVGYVLLLSSPRSFADSFFDSSNGCNSGCLNG